MSEFMFQAPGCHENCVKAGFVKVAESQDSPGNYWVDCDACIECLNSGLSRVEAKKIALQHLIWHATEEWARL